ncbi:amidohydrolase [Desulfolithobacter dissulfuricans]|uniref:Amidohydrolase n=1 Tax=Desulfolithobacter dissulfuricans TaxID=2795293 RepID=A0A915U3Z7_9BACT|nr:amidohydrolase family protein [Desulfolithobacter dissulfuricans]BCO10455.1 amidohydrolase [Desulfolithobacter dissulfuricans]
MTGIIDFHTHAFPDQVATKALPALEKRSGVKAYHDGTVCGLLASMDRAGIDTSVICSIATRPEQFQAIFDWSASIRSEKIIPLPSVHPADPELKKHIWTIGKKGFKGIKMHPFYQEFVIDDPALDSLYEALIRENLLLILHTGQDIGFPDSDCASPRRILNLVTRFPDLRLVTTHLGGWNMWDEVRRLLTGRPIYMELSFSLDFLDQIRLRDMITSHPRGYILFGSDSPWSDQATTLKMLRRLDLDEDLFREIVRENGRTLLGI